VHRAGVDAKASLPAGKTGADPSLLFKQDMYQMVAPDWLGLPARRPQPQGGTRPGAGANAGHVLSFSESQGRPAIPDSGRGEKVPVVPPSETRYRSRHGDQGAYRPFHWGMVTRESDPARKAPTRRVLRAGAKDSQKGNSPGLLRFRIAAARRWGGAISKSRHEKRVRSFYAAGAVEGRLALWPLLAAFGQLAL
jgi:hypothetical protein